MKHCGRCNTDKNEIEFNGNKTRKDGLQSFCKDCGKLANKKHYVGNKDHYLTRNKNRRKNTKDYILAYKQKHPCTVCGEDHPAALDFHHIENKSFAIASARGNYPIKRLQEEMDKCILLCANCHRKEHAAVTSLASNQLKG